MRDLYHNVLVTQVLSPVVSSTTKTSSAIDLQGFNSAAIVFAMGATGDTLSGSVYWTLKLQHSDTDSSYADLSASDLLNASTTIVVDSNSEDEQAYVFGYQGGKRYLKAVATPTGTHTNGTPIGIVVLRGNAGLEPVL